MHTSLSCKYYTVHQRCRWSRLRGVRQASPTSAGHLGRLPDWVSTSLQLAAVSRAVFNTQVAGSWLPESFSFVCHLWLCPPSQGRSCPLEDQKSSVRLCSCKVGTAKRKTVDHTSVLNACVQSILQSPTPCTIVYVQAPLMMLGDTGICA